MEKNKQKNKNMSGISAAHCLVLPFPSQTFIIPMLQFCKRLKDKGLTITLVLPLSFYKTLHKSSCITFPIETISDGYDHDLSVLDKYRGLTTYLTKFKQVGPQALTQLLLKMKKKKKVSPVDCIIYSSVLPWALDVAKKIELVGAAFFGFSCAVDCIYYNVHQGLLRVPLKRGRDEVMVQGLPVMKYRDMPTPIFEFGGHKDHYHMFVNQFSNVGTADWLFCNTFYELEKEVVVMMEQLNIGRFRPIGPHIPSKYLDKRLKYDKGYSQLCTLKPGSHECIKWLKEKPDGSVVYISVGRKWYDQTKELAWGIKGSNKSFLWEVELEESTIHSVTDNFLQETSQQGLIVTWCPKVEVLAQTSVGCFVTDCDWNSVLEAKSLGVPMVAMPRTNDQRTNAKYITDVWKTGIEAKPVENEWPRIARRDVVENCIREVMKGKRAGEIKRNAERWKELARKAVDEGGSSDRNIDEFVASLIHS